MPGKFLNTHGTDSEAQAITGLSASIASIRHLWRSALDLLYPPRCMGCDRVDTVWCARCQSEIDWLPVNLQRQTITDNLTVVASESHAGKLRHAVQALKYAGARPLAAALGQRLTEAYLTLDWSVDLIIPTPMHHDRLQQRGYNQAALIALQMAKECNIPYSETALIRHKYTRTQVGLNREERQINMRDAFTADTNIVLGQRVLIIDDVLTTGATIGGCAQTLYDSGATAVFGLTVTAARSDASDATLI